MNWQQALFVQGAALVTRTLVTQVGKREIPAPQYVPLPPPDPLPLPTLEGGRAPAPASGPAPVAPMQRPGCTAADETALTHYYLEKVGEGWQGAGVLALGVERLGRAAEGARRMGDEAVAAELEALRARLPDAKTPEAAAALAAEMEPLLPKTWELGRRCGGAARIPQAAMEEARALAQEVKGGRVTKEEAVARLRAKYGEGQHVGHSA